MEQKNEVFCLQDFEMIKILGTGAQSFVKLALHIPSGQYVALKVLSKHLYEQRKQVKYAFNEKTLLPLCVSPFTIHYLGSFQTQNFLYLVLEYVPGYELFEVIQVSKSGLSISLTQYISAQIILFLECLHAKKILYCDLKPENVMIMSDGFIKMVDFGLSGKLNMRGKISDACGTLSYFCPNKLRYQSYDEKSDVWCLGVVLYEMLTNRLLFSGDTRNDVLKKVINLRLTYPPNSAARTNSHARDLISQLLRLDPHKRPALQDVKQHPFYTEIRWENLALKKVRIQSQSFTEIMKKIREKHKNKNRAKSNPSHSTHREKPNSKKQHSASMKTKSSIWDRW